MSHIEDEEDEFNLEDIKSLATTVAFFTLMGLFLIGLLIFAIIKFI